MRALSKRERCLVALDLLAVAIALAWLGIVQPLVDGFVARAAERERLTALYQRNERLIGRAGSLRRVAERQRAGIADVAMRAGNAELATEMLKERLTAMLEGAGGQVQLVQGSAPRSGWVGAMAQVRLTNPQLVDAFSRIGTARPFVTFEKLSVAADRALVTGNLDIMDVQIEIAAPFTRANKG